MYLAPSLFTLSALFSPPKPDTSTLVVGGGSGGTTPTITNPHWEVQLRLNGSTTSYGPSLLFPTGSNDWDVMYTFGGNQFRFSNRWDDRSPNSIFGSYALASLPANVPFPINLWARASGTAAAAFRWVTGTDNAPKPDKLYAFLAAEAWYNDDYTNSFLRILENSIYPNLQEKYEFLGTGERVSILGGRVVAMEPSGTNTEDFLSPTVNLTAQSACTVNNTYDPSVSVGVSFRAWPYDPPFIWSTINSPRMNYLSFTGDIPNFRKGADGKPILNKRTYADYHIDAPLELVVEGPVSNMSEWVWVGYAGCAIDQQIYCIAIDLDSQ